MIFSFGLQITEIYFLVIESFYIYNFVKNYTTNNSLEELGMAKQFESSYSKWQKKSDVLFDKTKLDLNL